MNKKEFLETLSHKLKVLNQDEINDILNEYEGYIDNKIQEGKTEEEAVQGFGDMDDLAREILSAYKLNEDFIGRKGNTNSVLHQIVNVLTMFADSAVQFLSTIFKETDTEGLAQIIVTVIIGLVGLFFLRIPFWIMEGLGNLILAMVMPSFLRGLFEWLWSLICNIGYFASAIVLFINLLKKKEGGFHKSFTLNHPIFNINRDDSKSTSDTSLSLEKKQQSKWLFAQNNTLFDEEEDIYEYDYDYDEIMEEEKEESREKETEPSKQHNPIKTLVISFIQFFVVLFLSPFAIAIIALCIAVGILVFLAISGAHVWGIAILCAGIAGLFSALIQFIWRLTSPYKQPSKIAIKALISAVLLGAGTIITISDFTHYTFKSYTTNTANYTTRQMSSILTQDTTLHLYNAENTTLSVNETLADNEICITVQFPENTQLRFDKNDDEIFLYSYLDWNGEKRINQVQTMVRTFFEGIRQDIIYSFHDDNLIVTIEANSNTLTKLESVNHYQFIFYY